MALDLDSLEQRILGTLVEKEATVPESYPLTLNALLAGVNQKSNREPQMAAEEYEIEGALRSLMDRGFVTRVERAGGRTHRYEHQAREQLGVGPEELAILAELMNRGPQTPSELSTRASRMAKVGSAGDVERRLGELAARPVPYVLRLERRPREHAARWTHLLGKRAIEGDVPAAPASPAAAPRPAAAPTPTPFEPPRPMPQEPDLLKRVAELEDAVRELRDRLDRLMA